MLKQRLNDGSLLIDHFRNLKPSFWKDTVYDGFPDFYELHKKKDFGDATTYFWIQFPKPHSLASPNFFLDRIKELERYSWFKNYLFNVEFNPHIHCHLIIGDPGENLRPSRIIMNIGKHLGIKENNIECKRYSHSFNNRCNYVKGLKVPSDKQLLVSQDIEDRGKYNISTYYTDAVQETESSPT